MSVQVKLSMRDVIDIRRSYNSLGTSSEELASTYGVSQRTIQRIVKGEMWASVPTDKPLSSFGGKYEVTADGRVWSNTANSYMSLTNSGSVRLTKNGKKITVDVGDLVKEVFM